jgi:hypothetical protein
VTGPGERPEDAPEPLAEPLADRALDQPHSNRLSPDHPLRDTILAAHRAAMEAGRSSYTDPATGYLVMTSAYLAARGTCCDQGCRHCPYWA